jgi:hypothetical protein
VSAPPGVGRSQRAGLHHASSCPGTAGTDLRVGRRGGAPEHAPSTAAALNRLAHQRPIGADISSGDRRNGTSSRRRHTDAPCRLRAKQQSARAGQRLLIPTDRSSGAGSRAFRGIRSHRRGAVIVGRDIGHLGLLVVERRSPRAGHRICGQCRWRDRTCRTARLKRFPSGRLRTRRTPRTTSSAI